MKTEIINKLLNEIDLIEKRIEQLPTVVYSGKRRVILTIEELKSALLKNHIPSNKFITCNECGEPKICGFMCKNPKSPKNGVCEKLY